MLGGIDIQFCQNLPSGEHMAGGGNGPGNLVRGQMFKQGHSAGQGLNFVRHGVVILGVERAQLVLGCVINLAAQFAHQGGGEQAARHADAAVDAPDRHVNLHFAQGLAPGDDVIINAVEEGSVEIENKRRLGSGLHGAGLAHHAAVCDISWRICWRNKSIGTRLVPRRMCQ